MNIALFGYGKMGKEIEQIALQRNHTIVLKINRDNIQSVTPQQLKQADVAIEFSTPDTVIENIQKSFDANRIAYEENTLALPQVMTSWETYNMNRMNYLDELQAYYLMTADYEKEIEKN